MSINFKDLPTRVPADGFCGNGSLSNIIIASEPLNGDSRLIFDSPSGRNFIRCINKSKVGAKSNHLTYINHNQATATVSFTHEYLIKLLAYYETIEKRSAQHYHLVFVGKEAFDAFVEDYKKYEDSWMGSIIYLNKEKQQFEVSWPQLINKQVNLPYIICNTPDDLISTKRQEELIHQFDAIYQQGATLTEVTNAKYVSIPEFIDYLDQVLNYYKLHQIKYVAFDIETNTVEWADPWSKICLVSMADLQSKMAYSCAQFHPEVWVSELRNDFFMNLFTSLNKIYLTTTVSEINEKAKLLHGDIKLFRTETLVQNNEVVAWFEDKFLDEVDLLLTKLSKIKCLKKDVEEDKIKEIQAEIDGFAKTNEDLLKKVKNNIANTPQQLKQIKRLWEKLDEVLSIVPIVGQNIKFDVGFLYSKNIAKDKIHIVGDTLAEAVLLTNTLDEEGHKIDFDLESLYERETGKQNGWKSAFKASERIKVKLLGTRYDNVELDRLGPYSAMDSYGTLELFEKFKEKIKQRIAEDKCNKIEKLLAEQYKAVEMFCSGECMQWSPLKKFTKILYETAIKDTSEKLEILNTLSIVQKFKKDNNVEFNVNSSGSKSHKAIILFDKNYFNFTSLSTGKTGVPSTDADKVMKPLLAALKDVLNNNLKEVTYKIADRDVAESEKVVKIKVVEEFPADYKPSNKNKLITLKLVQEAKIFIESVLNYATWQKLKTAYIDSRWDDNNQMSIPYHSDFKIIGATYSGRISSGMHTLPKEGHIRDLYASIWNSDSTRIIDVNHEIGKTYNPTPGFVEIEYEDGTKETKLWKDLVNEKLDNGGSNDK